MKALLTLLLVMRGLAQADSVCVVNGMDNNGTASPTMEIFCMPTIQVGDPFGACYLDGQSGATQQQDITTQPNLGPYAFEGEPFLSMPSLFTNGNSVTVANGMNTELSAIFSAANAFDQTLTEPVNGRESRAGSKTD